MKNNSFINIIKNKILTREFISYFVAGVLTTLVNLAVYRLGLKVGMAYWIANTIAVFSSKLFAYITNKLFVFRTHCRNLKEFMAEIIKFIFARGFTGVIDLLGVPFLVEFLHVGKMISKYTIQAVVIVLNYILGKWFVFDKKKTKSNPLQETETEDEKSKTA